MNAAEALIYKFIDCRELLEALSPTLPDAAGWISYGL